MIVSKSGYSGIHPNSRFAFPAAAINFGGSPGRLGAIATGMS